MNPVIEAWIIIEKLASVCSTPGMSQDVLDQSNKMIARLLKDVVDPGLSELTAKKAGLILK